MKNIENFDVLVKISSKNKKHVYVQKKELIILATKNLTRFVKQFEKGD